jgi:hypothetical protein
MKGNAASSLESSTQIKLLQKRCRTEVRRKGTKYQIASAIQSKTKKVLSRGPGKRVDSTDIEISVVVNNCYAI